MRRCIDCDTSLEGAQWRVKRCGPCKKVFLKAYQVAYHKATYVAAPVRFRTCEDCPSDISHLGPQAQICKPCRRKRLTAAQKAAYARDPTKTNEANRRWWHANREKCREDNRKWREANREQIRAKLLAAKYGLSTADYDAMYQAQRGRCACCGDEKPSRTRNGLVVDHCHDSGVVRSLLCATCNKLEGFLRINPRQYEAVIEYHRRFARLRLVK